MCVCVCVCVCMCVCVYYINSFAFVFSTIYFSIVKRKNSISDIPRKNENFSFTFAHFDILRPIIVQLKLEYIQW